MSKKSLSASDILSVNDNRVKEVKVPEWGGSVFIKMMSGAERNLLEQEWMSNDEKPTLDIVVALLSLTLCDADGKRLFSTEEEAAGLINKSASVLQRLMMESLQHNGMSQDALDDAVKN